MEERIHSLCVGWRNFFASYAVVSVFCSGKKKFWSYILLMYLGYCTIQLWCCVSFFGSGGKYLLVLHMYLVYSTVVLLCQFSCCGRKVNCKHGQPHVDFLKNDYSVSLFSRNNSLAKTHFLWNPNFLLLHISFLFSINQHHYNHDHFSKISRSFCGSRNWWIIIVLFLNNSVKCTILSQKISRPSPTFPLQSFLKNIENILCK